MQPQDIMMISVETTFHLTRVTTDQPDQPSKSPRTQNISLRPIFSKTSEFVSLDGLNAISSFDRLPAIKTISAENVQEKRYHESRTRNLISSNTKDYHIPSMTTVPLRRPAPPGWQFCIHPEGCIYYFRDIVISGEDSWKVRIITQADLAHDEAAEMIEGLAMHIYNGALHYPSFPREVDLVLELMDAENTIGYYFVHHKNRCLFWLEEFDGTVILQECSGVSELSHKQIELEAQYWKHIDLFPHASTLHSDILRELRQIIRFAIGDCMTSEVSAVCAFGIDVLNNALSLINDVDVENDYVRSTHDLCFIARMMNHFKHCQYLNYHGQQGARLSRDQSVHGNTYEERSVMMKFLAPLLFNAPSEHLFSLHKIYVDSIVNHLDWRNFVQRLNAEMQEFNLLATVLLSVNVGFLAIQSVDSGGGYSLSHIASYMSVISSFGSMLLGVKLARASHTQGLDMVDNAQAHLQRLLHPKYGLETLAIIYSLPYALLVWGMILFVLAFFAECFHWSDVVPTVTVTVSSFVVLMLIMWSWRTLGGSTLKCSEQWDIRREFVKDARRRMRELVTFSAGRQESSSHLQSAVA